MTIERQVENWLAEFVIGHHICPFAKRPFTQKRVRIRAVETEVEEEAVKALLYELSEIVATERTELETTLLVFPNLFPDFEDFWSFCEWTEELLEASGAEGLIQLVGFHPDFYFAESETEDLANFTNRSPFPLLHLLREESVEEAVAQHGAVEEIPARNAAYLRGLKKHLLEDLAFKHE